jgi:hypothetical protein
MIVLRILFLSSCFLLCKNAICQVAKDSVVVLGKPENGGGDVFYRLQGHLQQTENDAPVAGASIFFGGINRGTVSDENGDFQMSLKKGLYRLTIRHVGMETQRHTIEINAAGIVNFKLIEKTATLEEVIVMAESEERNIEDPLGGINKLSINEVKRIPPLLGEIDVVKTLQLLPGVTSVGEGSSGFNVRGGGTDQNLILIDGIQVFNTSHLLGFFSAFNADATSSFALYKGNVPAQFGGRSSSVLDVKVRNGDANKYRVTAGAGLMSGKLTFEGPIIKNKSSFLLASRFSYSDWLLRQVKNPEVRNSSASFYDITANVAHRINEKNQLSLTAFNSHDFFRFSEEFGYEYASHAVGIQWNSIINARWSALTSASYGIYSSSFFDPAGYDSKRIANGINYYHFQENFFFIPNEKHSLAMGFEHTGYYGRAETSTAYMRDPSFVNESIPRDKGREFAAFLSDELIATPVFSISGGVRYTFYQNVGKDQVYVYEPGVVRNPSEIIDTLFYSTNESIASYGGLEPRLSIRIATGNTSSIKVSFNRLRQNIHQISNATTPTPVDFWQVSNFYIKPQIADQYSIGYFRNFKTNIFETYVEAYIKRSQNLLDYKDFAELLLNPHIETELVSGRGRSFGAEIFLKKNAGPWKGWITYTYSRSLIQVIETPEHESINSGEWYPTNFDKPHNLTIVANRTLQKSGSFGLIFTYSTGRPMTAILSSYQSGSASVPVFSDRNQYRIPDYLRVDLSLTIGNIFSAFEDSLTLSIYNLLGRKNAYSVYYQRQEQLPLPQSYKLSMLGSAVPSATYTITF